MSRFDMAEFDRRLGGVVRVGRIEELDPKAGRVKARINADILTGWCPWLAPRAGKGAVWWAPEVGEQCLVLAQYGEPDQAVVLVGLFSDAFPPPSDNPEQLVTVFPDGARLAYDWQAKRLEAVLPDSGTVRLVAPGGVTIEGDVTVTGDVVAGGVSLRRHTHGGVDTGGGNTAEPNGGG